MPVLPCQSIGLCRKVKEVKEYLDKKIVYSSKRYTIFIVIMLELLSSAISYLYVKDYVFFFYPLFANNTILILLYKDYCNRKILRYCKRTTLAIQFLLIYFLINTIVISTGFVIPQYYNIVTYLLLFCSAIILLITFNQKK